MHYAVDTSIASVLQNADAVTSFVRCACLHTDMIVEAQCSEWDWFRVSQTTLHPAGYWALAHGPARAYAHQAGRLAVFLCFPPWSVDDLEHGVARARALGRRLDALLTVSECARPREAALRPRLS